MSKEIKLYMLQLLAEESMTEASEFNSLTEETNYCGVYPEYPYVYVAYRTNEERLAAFHKFDKVFKHCKVVRNAMYADEKYLKGYKQQ